MPPGIDADAHQQGLEASLANLAARFPALERDPGVGPAGYSARVRQRDLETADRCASPVCFSGATPGTTGTSGHGTARDSLRSAAGHRAHDGTGRAALPHRGPVAS